MAIDELIYFIAAWALGACGLLVLLIAIGWLTGVVTVEFHNNGKTLWKR